MASIKINAKYLTVGGKRVRISLCGPNTWVDGVDPATIKIRPWAGKNSFPASFREAFAIENNSDTATDYFEADSIRLLPGHPMYDEARKAVV